jgi:tetratricopeptide (TPR) repeat protein
VLTAEQLYERASRASNHGRNGEARRTLTRAMRRVDEPVLRARILLSLAYHEAERGHVEEGLALLAEGTDPELPTETLGLLASQRALILMRAGREADALDAFDQALSLLDENDPLPIARAAINRGDVHLQRRDLPAARADFERAVDVASRHRLEVQRSMAMHNLGYVDLLSGDLPAALRRMTEVAPAFESMSPAYAAVSHADRAQVLVSAGLLTEADQDLAAAAAAFGSLRMRQDQAEAELARASLAHAQREHAKAEHLARQAKARFQRRGSESWALKAELVRLGARAAAGKTPAATRFEAQRLAAQLSERGLADEARTAWLTTARALVAAGQHERARDVLRRHRVPLSAPITTRLLAQTVRSEIAEAADDRRGMFAAATRGLRELQQWQASFGGLDLQTGLCGHGRELARRALFCAVDTGRPDVVFTWAQRARALVSRIPPVTPPADPRARELLEELRQLRVALQHSADPALVARRASLERAVQQRSWHSQGPGVISEELALPQLQAELGPVDGTFVAHVPRGDQLHALVVTASASKLVPMGSTAGLAETVHRVRADLDASASDQAHAGFRTVLLESLRGSLDELSSRLWDPIAELTGTGPLLLVPPGALAALPWTMLRGLAGRPLSVARSLSSWSATRSAQRVERIGMVAGPSVPRAREEVTRASAEWPSVRALTGDTALTAGATVLAEDVDLLHIAAHGKHDAGNPLFSSLQLTDGLWFGHDIARLQRLPRHVVLSSCELGLSTVRWGDETLGMTAAWLHAGTSSVISAVADVNDRAACDVLAGLHSGLASGLLPAAALARAMQLHGSDTPAPFVCFGAGW